MLGHLHNLWNQLWPNLLADTVVFVLGFIWHRRRIRQLFDHVHERVDHLHDKVDALLDGSQASQAQDMPTGDESGD